MHILLWIIAAEDRLGLHKCLSPSCDTCQVAGGHVAIASGGILGEMLWDGNGQPCRVLAAVQSHGPTGTMQGPLWHIQWRV